MACGYWERLKVPARHKAKLRECTGHPQWNTALERLLDMAGTGFLGALLGKRGTGKTQLAVALLARCCWGHVGRRCEGIGYITAFDFFLQLRKTYNGTESELAIIDRLAEHALLVVDEAGVRGHSEWEDRNLTYLIDRRYGAMRDTLLVSNQTPEAFAQAVGPSIADRLRECGGIIECTWKSFR